MIEYFQANAGQILDGLLFGLGVLAVYLGAVFTGALIRSYRLVTLTGPGGIGKTRLAIAVGAALDGPGRRTEFVPLASITDPALVLPRVAAAVGAPIEGTRSALDKRSALGTYRSGDCRTALDARCRVAPGRSIFAKWLSSSHDGNWRASSGVPRRWICASRSASANVT